MAEKPLSLQDHFLNSIRRSRSPVTIFLVKGVKLQGVVTWFDAFSLLLRRDGSSQLIYKHSISTIMPGDMPADFAAAHKAGQGGRAALQDRFLAAAERNHEGMTVYLVNGVMLQGAVAGFDQFSLLLERGGQVQLVYKHAISTLQPAQSLDLEPEEGESGDPSTGEPTEPSTEESTEESTRESTKEPTGEGAP
jgi:host factor-I protein